MAKVSIRNPGCVCQIRPARRVEASQAVEVVGTTIRAGAKMQMMVRCSAVETSYFVQTEFSILVF